MRYMIYRSFVALVFVGGISGHIANSRQGAKWLIYMTDQGIAFLGKMKIHVYFLREIKKHFLSCT